VPEDQGDTSAQEKIVLLDSGKRIAHVTVAHREIPSQPGVEFGNRRGIENQAKLIQPAEIRQYFEPFLQDGAAKNLFAALQILLLIAASLG